MGLYLLLLLFCIIRISFIYSPDFNINKRPAFLFIRHFYVLSSLLLLVACYDVIIRNCLSVEFSFRMLSGPYTHFLKYKKSCTFVLQSGLICCVHIKREQDCNHVKKRLIHAHFLHLLQVPVSPLLHKLKNLFYAIFIHIRIGF